MPKTLSSYPSIYAIGHAALDNLFADEVQVEEKVDGSQFSFGLVNGLLVCRSKGKEQSPGEAVDKMFEPAVAALREIQGDLREGWVYRGEYLSKPKHNTIAYSRTPARLIIIFDIEVGPQRFLRYDQRFKECQRLGLECVPILTSGRIDSPEVFHQLLDTDSILGGAKIEGVVVKNYSQFGRDGKVLMGKFVSEAFKEKHAGEWKTSHPGAGDVITQLVDTYRAEARWVKAIQHLRERGELQSAPQDIGPLLKEIQTDIHHEEADEIREALFKWAWPQISRRVTAGFAEWYKQRLLDSAFD